MKIMSKGTSRKMIFSFLIYFLVWSFLVVSVTIGAYYNFMAPGVPSGAQCVEGVSLGKLSFVMDPSSTRLNLNSTGTTIRLLLKNDSSKTVYLGKFYTKVVFDSSIAQVESLSLNGRLDCLVNRDTTLIHNDEKRLEIDLSSIGKDGCPAIEIPAGDVFEIGQLAISPVNIGATTFEPVDTQIYDSRNDTTGVLKYASGANVEVVNKGYQPAPTTSKTVPSTGVFDSHLLLLMFGIVFIAIGLFYELKPTQFNV